MSNKCETCNGSGYVWREGPDGKTWMCDCDNDECNAFGQFDECIADETSVQECGCGECLDTAVSRAESAWEGDR